MKRIRQGNTINFRYSLYRSDGELKEPEDLTGLRITAVLRNRLYGLAVDVPFSVEGNVLTAQLPGLPYLKTGVYNFCLSYRKDETDFTIDTDAFQIVDSSAKAGGADACPGVETETVELFGSVEFVGSVGAGMEQIQSDWEETNPQSKAFIRRKPLLSKVATSGSYADLTGRPVIPTVTNDFTDAEKQKLAGLTNYDDTALTQKVTAVEKKVQDMAVPTKTSELDNDAGFITGAGLAAVATSGSYADLTGRPVIPTITNDFTDAEKQKLAGLTNYDDTEVRNLVEKKANAIPVKSVSDPNGSVGVYAIDPNVFYDFDYCGTLHLSLNPSKDSGLLNEYMFQFISADSSTTLVIDGPVQWLNGQPALKPDYLYQVSIVNNLAIIGGIKYGEV